MRHNGAANRGRYHFLHGLRRRKKITYPAIYAVRQQNKDKLLKLVKYYFFKRPNPSRMDVNNYIAQSIEMQQRLIDGRMADHITRIARQIEKCFARGYKVLIAGNGGSAADAQHFAAELAGRFEKKERKPLPAIALTTNTSNLTAIANDFGFEHVFSRQLEALGKEGDIFIGISTSGNSADIIEGFKRAREMKIDTIGLSGHDGGAMRSWCDEIVIIPSSRTPHIQETHILLIHAICAIIDEEIDTPYG